MASEWHVVTLGDVANVRSGYAFKSKDWSDSGIPVVKIANVKNGRLDMTKCSYVPTDIAAAASEFNLQRGDILIAMTGYIGDIALVRQDDLPCVLNQRVGRFSIKDPRRLHDQYLFYFLRSSDTRKTMEDLGYGSAQPNVSPKLIHSVEIPLPPLSEQRAIACILGALDDKIELNRRMNETLEGMARAIFKSWFVDFDPVRAKAEGQQSPGLAPHIADLFPDAFEESELGEIPKGWRVGRLGDIIEIHDSKRIPLSSRERQKRQGPFPYYGAAGIVDHIDDFLFDGIYVLVGEDGSVVTDTGKPVVQYVWGKFWVNNHAHVLKGTGGISDEQLLLLLQQVYVVPFVTGAVQPKLSQTNMKAIPVVHASPTVNQVFGDIVRPVFAKIRAMQDEVETLAILRDTLLPRLISGELRVPDAERIVGRCV